MVGWLGGWLVDWVVGQSLVRVAMVLCRFTGDLSVVTVRWNRQDTGILLLLICLCVDLIYYVGYEISLYFSPSCCMHRVYDVVPFSLQSLLTDENLQSVPFLVLGNKIDMPSAVSEDELR